MASPFAGPTAVADVIKDVEMQIAVSKRGLAPRQHAGVRWRLRVPLVLPRAILRAPQDREMNEQNRLRLTKRASARDAGGENRLLPCMAGEDRLGGGGVVNGGDKQTQSAGAKAEVREQNAPAAGLPAQKRCRCDRKGRSVKPEQAGKWLRAPGDPVAT